MARSEVYLNKKLYEVLRIASEKKGTTRSVFLNELLAKLDLNGEEYKSVLLQIPVELLSDNKERLKTWLDERTNWVLNNFYK